MKDVLVLFGALFLFVADARATVLTFDDVPGGSIPGQDGVMPTTYKGFNFSSNLYWGDVENHHTYGAHSGDFVVFNNVGNAGVITAADGSDFTFDGLWAKRWYTSPGSGGPELSGLLRGYNDGVLIWSVVTGINGTYKFFDPQDGAIDQLVLGLGNYFLVDDITLNAVPIPPAIPLFVSGLGLMGYLGRRRKKLAAAATV